MDICLKKYEVPSTKWQLIDHFRESLKEIVPAKIKELSAEKERLLQESAPYFQKLAGKDPLTKYFCRETFKILHPEIREVFRQLDEFTWIEKMIDNRDRVREGEVRKERAKTTPLVRLFSFQRLRKVGGRFTALCPLHKEDTPSFTIYPDNSWWCFGCNRGGDSIDFIQALKNCDFKEALQTIG